jgi:probable phosphomutase (TIGR03848 family)
VTTVLLIRHGLTAVTGTVLLGWTPGVGLDARGRAQARALAQRLGPLPLDAIVSSPLQRCQETAAAVAAHRPAPATGTDRPAVTVDDRLGECHYGDWTGQKIADLIADPVWRTVQEQPSAVVFPGPRGEALRDTQHRAVAAIRAWNTRLGPAAVWLACSHGDVIKTIVADALGIHLDLFQRIVVDPCSLTVIRYTGRRPFVIRMNDRGGGVADVVAARQGLDGPVDGNGGVGGGAETTGPHRSGQTI